MANLVYTSITFIIIIIIIIIIFIFIILQVFSSLINYVYNANNINKLMQNKYTSLVELEVPFTILC